MEEDIFKSVEEDLAEAIQEISPHEEPLLNQDVPILKKSKKISEKSDDTEKEKDELQIEEVKEEKSKNASVRQMAQQKSSTEARKDKKVSSKTEEVKLQKVAVEKIQAKQIAEEDPWAQITLNRCIIVAAVIVVFSMGVQLIVGVFEVDDVLVYSDSGVLDDEDLKLAERTMLEDQVLIPETEKTVTELEKKLPPQTPGRTDLKKTCITLKGKPGGCKVEAADKKQISASIKEIKSIKSGYKPRDKDSEPRSSKDRKDHKPEFEKKDDKYFKKEHKEEKHRGHQGYQEQHFKEGDGKKLSKGKEECDKGNKFNQLNFPRRHEKNAKQGTYNKQQGHYKDFEKHKYYMKQDDNKKHDYKMHKEYNKYRMFKRSKHGGEKIYKKAGLGKHFGKNKFKESRKHN
ncbi:calponin homology domain-containing protein DDB_G0272472-like [Heterodontus francisci]|uniref:calponin homology domain-containing protein DDB_G0272472-like n=1 Tax=Heterodontus francisci TaxID=7792 RepID=UPI00355C47C7